jgi:general secretion pathway protein C
MSAMRLDTLLLRHFWMVTVVVVVACSGLAASAAAHIIAATILAEPSAPLPRPVARWTPPIGVPQVGAGQPDHSNLLVQRNIFCSACEPPVPTAPAGAPQPGTEPPLTALPLRLIATRIGPAGTLPRATISNTSTAQQGAVRLGDPIPGAGEVKRIAGSYVDFHNALTSRIERISLLGPRPAAPRPTPPSLPPSPRKKSARAELLAKIDAGVRQRGEGSFEIDRAVLDEVLAHPLAASRGARVLPAIENGRPRGFKLTRVKRKSVYAKIGFKSGDTIHAVNGFELTSMDKALEVYTRFRAANHVVISLTRRGKPLTLDYTIR